MKEFKLTPSQEQALRIAHKHFKRMKDARSAYRVNAIILLGTGWSLAEVSEALLFDEGSLSNYVERYRMGGIETLTETQYSGGTQRLSAVETENLTKELDSKIYLTTQEICAWVEAQFGIVYSRSGMSHLLHRLGYAYKKPKIVPGNPDALAQEIFLKNFEDFMENKPKNEKVFFVDAVHAVHNVQPAYGWIKKGVEKPLQSNTGRKRLNIHGAMDAETYAVVTLSSERNVDGSSTVELLEYLLKLHPHVKKLHIILDNARYHYSREVQEFLKNARINLVFLPPYSPQLNLIERLWRLFKKTVLANRYYETFKRFKAACIGFFKNQEQHAAAIHSIMGEGLSALSS